MGRGFGIGRLFGIPLRLDLSWLLGLAFLVAGAGRLWSGEPGGVPPLVLSVAFALTVFASVVAHELAHALVARALGVPTTEIRLFVFGGVARIAAEPGTPGGEALMALAGPLTSISVAAIGGLVAEAVPGQAGELIGLVAVANLILAIFNLLPGFPLDGGRIARAVVWRLSGNRVLATRITAWIGRVLALALLGGGLVAFFVTGSPRFLVDSVLGLFLLQAARHGELSARRMEALGGRTAGELMRPLRSPVPAWATLADVAARGLLPTDSSPPVPVVGGDGRAFGQLQASRVAEVPPLAWPSTPAGAVAAPLEPGAVTAVDTPLASLVNGSLAQPCTGFLVLDRDGRPVGWLEGAAVAALLEPGPPGARPTRSDPSAPGLAPAPRESRSR